MIDHPMDKLSLYGEGLAIESAGGIQKPYMHTLPVSVVAKLKVEQTAGNNCRYFFRLDVEPCPVWEEIFQINLRDDTIGIIGDVMSFECIPAALESRYNRTKEAFTKTNADFAAGREKLVAELQERERQETQLQENRSEARTQIQQQFNSLEL
jgi:hypothetical protein